MAPVSEGFRYGAEPIRISGLRFPGGGLELPMSGSGAGGLRRRWLCSEWEEHRRQGGALWARRYD